MKPRTGGKTKRRKQLDRRRRAADRVRRAQATMRRAMFPFPQDREADKERRLAASGERHIAKMAARGRAKR